MYTYCIFRLFWFIPIDFLHCNFCIKLLLWLTSVFKYVCHIIALHPPFAAFCSSFCYL